MFPIHVIQQKDSSDWNLVEEFSIDGKRQKKLVEELELRSCLIFLIIPGIV